MDITFYNNCLLFVYLAMLATAPAAGITICICKKSLKYAWLYLLLCAHGFVGCLLKILWWIGHDDVTSPNYEGYLNWNLGSSIAEDIKLFSVFLFAGVICYLAFIKKRRALRIALCVLLAVGVVAVAVVLCFSAVFTLRMTVR